MQWEGRQESTNVEDRRGLKPAGLAIGGGGILILIVAIIFGVDPRRLGLFNENQPGQQRFVPEEEQKHANFTKIVFRDTELVWQDQFQANYKKDYPKPTLVLYSDKVDSRCGQASSSVGPFYCPADTRVYIDLSFYADMQRQLNAPGEFARAYVVAHEVGHHVQRVLGYSARVDEARQGGNQTEANRMSVRLELQADYLAGVWAHHAKRMFNTAQTSYIDERDIASALNCANQIGDDRLQKKYSGRIQPDRFTHGTSQQRERWFREGYKRGDVKAARILFDLSYDEL